VSDAVEEPGLAARVDVGEGVKEPAVEQADALRTARPKEEAWYLDTQGVGVEASIRMPVNR